MSLRLSRAATLADVVMAVSPSDQEADDGFRKRLVGFLDDFYSDADPRSQKDRLVGKPVRTRDPRTGALIGAIGEHLCHRWMLGAPPAWTRRRFRFLKEPWFMSGERMKPFLLKESPTAFRRRLIFTEAEPLRRISMPRDGRWWSYEILRTGMTPQDGDIAPSRRFRPADERHGREDLA